MRRKASNNNNCKIHIQWIWNTREIIKIIIIGRCLLCVNESKASIDLKMCDALSWTTLYSITLFTVHGMVFKQDAFWKRLDRCTGFGLRINWSLGSTARSIRFFFWIIWFWCFYGMTWPVIYLAFVRQLHEEFFRTKNDHRNGFHEPNTINKIERYILWMQEQLMVEGMEWNLTNFVLCARFVQFIEFE